MSRKRFRSSCLILAALLQGSTFSSHAMDPVSSAVTFMGIEQTANGVIDHASQSSSVLLKEAGLELQRALAKFKEILGDEVRTPIEKLDQSARNELNALRFMVTSLQQSIDSLPQCVGNEADILGANVKSGFASALNQLPFIDGEPIAYLVQSPLSRAPYMAMKPKAAKGDLHLIVRGANLWKSGEACEINATAHPITVSASTPQTLRVVSYDPEKVELALPANTATGAWNIRVNAKVPRLFGSCWFAREESINASIDVREPAAWAVEPRLTPICASYEEKTVSYGGSCTNGSLKKDKSCAVRHPTAAEGSGNLIGWTLVSYTGRQTENRKRDSGSVTIKQDGDSILATTGVRKMKVGENQTSRTKWAGTMTFQRPVQASPQPKWVVSLKDELVAGESVRFEGIPPAVATCPLHRIAVGAVIKPSGPRSGAVARDIPDVIGLLDASITASGSGVMVTYSYATGSGTVEVAGQGCLGGT